MEVTDYIFPTEPDQLQSFIEKHDKVTDQLEVLAAKDDLLTGNYIIHTGWTVICHNIKPIVLPQYSYHIFRCTKQIYSTCVSCSSYSFPP